MATMPDRPDVFRVRISGSLIRRDNTFPVYAGVGSLNDMSSNGRSGRDTQTASEPILMTGPPLSRWQRVRLVIKVAELRLRFIALMAVTGWVFANWDMLWNRYDKWMRPAADRHAAISGVEHYCPMHPQVVQDDPGACPICGMPL